MAGHIVYVRLRNFMSYDDIELRPGPHLNLIIGPNGTGKSTFVCAVLLGLGGKLKVLGRGDHLSAFIRTGCKESIIDVELYESDVETIHVTRKIYPNNNSDFWINGKPAAASKVNDIKSKYNIHLENLCTFLPQEKVQDFAGLNPQQLLIQTQKTVGSEEMIAAYDKLKNIKFTLKDKEEIKADLQGKLEQEIQKNERLKDKVQSYFEKRALCDKLNLLNQKKSWLSYHADFLRMEGIAKDCKLAEGQYAKKKEAFAKVSRQLQLVEEEIKKSGESLSRSKRACTDQQKNISEGIKKVNEKIVYLEHSDKKLQLKLAAEEEKKEELIEYQETFDKLNNDLRSFESANGTDEELKTREVEVIKKLDECIEEDSKLIEIRESLNDQLRQDKMELEHIKLEFDFLKKKKCLRLEYIRRCEPDVYRAMEWLKENTGIFQSHIYNPMLLEIDVTDRKMAKYVESRVSYRDLISFTCTSTNDFNLLIQHLRVEQKLKINVVCSEEDDITKFSPKIPLDQINSLGFFSYMKDLIVGPNHMIRFLCSVYNIHNIPVGDETVKANCENVPKEISIFYSKNHMYTVKGSVYSDVESITVKELYEPKLLCHPSMRELAQKLQERQNELETTVEKIESKIKVADDRCKSSAKKLESIRRTKREITILREEMKPILFKISRTKRNIQSIQETLRDPTEIRREAEEKKDAVKEEIHQNLHTLAEACKNLEKCSFLAQECEIRHKQYRLKVAEIDELKARSSLDLRKSEETLNNLKVVKREAEKSCHHLKEEAKKLTDGLSPGESGFEKFEKKFQDLKNTVEELEKEIEETEVRCDFIREGNAEILQEYEKREKYIANMEALLEQARNGLKETEAVVSKLRDKWLSFVNDLVSTVNENFGKFFEKMGCVGEVSLTCGANENDFDQYGITIKVKFREEIPLQSLGRHFQSGGERAVTTAVYLLSLQKLISVPFRFVDEINQGMDLANEVRMMNLMMKVTNDDNSSQYFFITPKLLPNITCSETVVTHCIYSGQKVPSNIWNLQKFLSSR